MGVLGGYDHLALQQFSGMMVGGPPPQLRPIKLGRGVADPAAYAHKLFIGQIPFEVGRGACALQAGSCAWGSLCGLRYATRHTHRDLEVVHDAPTLA